MKRLILLAVLVAASSAPASAQDANRIAEGARLWAGNCTRCHNARSPAERTPREWMTVVNHMRARANLTRTEAQKITVYLQAISTPRPATAHASAPSARPDHVADP